MHSRQTTRISQTQTSRSGELCESPAGTVCRQIVDACLVGVIFVAPLFFGGRHPVGRLVFIILACLAAVFWFSYQALTKRARWTPSKAYAIGIASLLLVTLQLIPLPSSWLEQLAPRSESLLSLWTSDASESVLFGAWPTLSLTPSSTKIALATLVAYVLLFVTTVGRIQTLADVERLLRLIAISAIGMSGFGLLQYFTSNGLFFWFYELPYSTTENAAKGSFSCRNHFAHFLVLGVAPLLGWIVLRFQQRTQRGNDQVSSPWHLDLVLCLGLFLTVFAVLLSFSRGGALALAVASTLGLAIYFRRGLVSSSFLNGLVALGIFVIAVLSINGYEQVASRLDDFTSGSLEKLDQHQGRRKIWAANLAATEQGSFFGAGAGSHREIYPVYLPESLNLEYTHAENGYLQIATECGYLGMGLLALSLAAVARWCWQSIRQSLSVRQLVASVAVTSALVASVVHSLFDFVWFIPACMSLTILLAASALRLAQLSAAEEVEDQLPMPWPRLSWIGLAIATSLATIWAGSVTIGPARAATYWEQYQSASQVQKQQSFKRLFAFEVIPDKQTAYQSHIETAIFNLQHVLSSDSNSARANLRLAGKYLQLFDIRQRDAENSMSIDQIRDAAIASKFSSANELQQWLLQAFGDNSKLLYQAYRHTHKALQLCPLQGEGYLYLANLCFLNGHGEKVVDAYVGQSLKVRPHDGQVLFEAGRQELLLGRGEEAINLWSKVFRDRGTHQLQIIKLLAGYYPASAFLETFQPDWRALSYVRRGYNKIGSEGDRQSILKYAELFAERECPGYPAAQAAPIWRSLAKMQRTLDEPNKALISLERAFKAAPSDYGVRREYGQALLKSQHYRLAEPHLRWCFARRPDDARLHKDLVKANNGCIAQMANAPSNRSK